MKVALLISGLPRIFNYTYPFLKKYVIDELNPDIFFYGYSDLKNGITEQDVLGTYNPISSFIREWDMEDQELVWKEYGTKELHNNTVFHPLSPIKTISQHYNIMKANELKKDYENSHNFKYDVVIRSRTDYYYYRPLTFGEISNVQENSVHIPSLWDFSGFTDGFAYGTSESIDKYANLFKKCKSYNLDDKIEFSPELLLKHHIINGEKMKRIDMQIPCFFYITDFEKNGFKDRLVGDFDVSSVPRRNAFP